MGALVSKINEYQDWRNNLVRVIGDYGDWLAASTLSDEPHKRRLYDVLETLKRDQLMVAFLAASSRGKTETINALFFSDFNQSLLPGEPSLNTMCPTEIFWDAREEPCIKLLPIGTRLSDDTLTTLKTKPNAWTKFKLNIDSPEEIKASLLRLVAQKEVTRNEAAKLGLFNPQDVRKVNELEKQSLLKIPAWRHAVINYPHPLLIAGLVVLDTPGLDTLTTEPEIMLNVIPRAHALVFLTAVDTGMTPSDRQIWYSFIKDHAKYKLALLNKIDLLWDDLKPEQDVINEIDKQVDITVQQLGIPPESLFAISAQKALMAKIKNNHALLQQSGIQTFEAALGDQLIKAKHEVLGRTVGSECSVMIRHSRKLLQHRLLSLREQVLELCSLRDQNPDVAKPSLAKVVADRKRYEATMPTFTHANNKLLHIGKRLLRHLSVGYLDSLLMSSRQEMGNNWTLTGLNQAMRSLMQEANKLAANVTKESREIKTLAETIYHVFQTRHNFDVFEPPKLDISNFLTHMQALEKVTTDFCNDPANGLAEKHYLIRKFFLGLGIEIQKIFAQTEKGCSRWIEDVLNALNTQMIEHKNNLDQRINNLAEAKENAAALDSQLARLEREYTALSKDSQALDSILLLLIKAVKPAVIANLTEKAIAEFNQLMQLPELPLLNMTDLS